MWRLTRTALLLVVACCSLCLESFVVPPTIVAAFVSFPHSHQAYRTGVVVLFGWSQIYEANNTSPDGSVLRHSSLLSNDVSRTLRLLDLSSPREWLEFRQGKDGGTGGAYTVLRCDPPHHHRTTNLLHDNHNNNNHYTSSSWYAWGLDFHLDRLETSYRMLHPDATIQSLQQARNTSHRILHDFVLKDALVDQITSQQASLERTEASNLVLMVTFLWTKRLQTHGANGTSIDPIAVHVHTCTVGQPTTGVTFPNPIQVSLGLSSAQEKAPNRYSHLPEAKLSSWCRERRILEETYKQQGDIAEVLLVRQVQDDQNYYQLLEGLTSNLFVVYRNGKLRTAMDGSVLQGYARSLVLESAAELGLELDDAPILLKEADLWEEVFLTSAVKLIVPVSKIWKFVSTSEQTTVQELSWSARNNFSTARKLYETILKKHNDSCYIHRNPVNLNPSIKTCGHFNDWEKSQT